MLNAHHDESSLHTPEFGMQRRKTYSVVYGMIAACPPKRAARRRLLFEIVNAASNVARMRRM
jgi:hypothetical protein